MSDTPRTDANQKYFFSSISGLRDPSRDYVPIEFARTLERELNALKQELERVKADRNKAALEERKKLLPEIKRLRTALGTIAAYDEESIWMDARDDAADAMLELAREALNPRDPNDRDKMDTLEP